MNAQESKQFSQGPLHGLTRGSLVIRFIIIAFIVGGIALLFAYAGGWLSPQRLSPKLIINRFEQLNGQHPGFRRNHAKGVCVSGFFESNGNGVALSKTSAFAPGRVPVIGRFAVGGGQPYAADDAHNVRSMALLFQLPGGEEWRMGINNIPVFPVKTPQGFYDLLLSSAPEPATGKPNPDAMKNFFAKNPEALKAIQAIQGNVVSSGFKNSTYNSLDAFRFINAEGKDIPVRWSMVSVQPFEPLGTAPADKNYLFDELVTSIKSKPLQWRLVVTIGQPEDVTSDPTIAWPSNRQQVDVGTLTIDHVESEDTSPARDINFDPLILPNGIAGSDDPILSARSAAYAKSFARREGEHKEPSAISSSETGK